MKVIKFFTLNPDDKKVEQIIWYVQDTTKRSKIILRVEQYLRSNKLSCIMDVVKFYHDRKEFEQEEKNKVLAKFDYIILGCD